MNVLHVKCECITKDRLLHCNNKHHRFHWLNIKKKDYFLSNAFSLYQLGEQLCPVLSLEQLYRLLTEWQTHYHLEPRTCGLFPPDVSGMEKEDCTSAMKSFGLERMHVTSAHNTEAKIVSWILTFSQGDGKISSFTVPRKRVKWYWWMLDLSIKIKKFAFKTIRDS